MSKPIIVQIPNDEYEENETTYDWAWPMAILLIIVALGLSINMLDPTFLAPLFVFLSGLGV